MSTKFILKLTAATGIILVASLTVASAQEAVTVIGTKPTAHCATTAAEAGTSRVVTRSDVDVCTQALAWARTMHENVSATLLNRGVLHLIRSEYQAAITDINSALSAGVDPAVALNNRGIAEAALHQYAAADADYTQALEHNPEHPETIYFNRAMNDEDMGDMKRAYQDYTKAAQANPSWDRPAKELARFTVVRPSLS